MWISNRDDRSMKLVRSIWQRKCAAFPQSRRLTATKIGFERQQVTWQLIENRFQINRFFPMSKSFICNFVLIIVLYIFMSEITTVDRNFFNWIKENWFFIKYGKKKKKGECLFLQFRQNKILKFCDIEKNMYCFEKKAVIRNGEISRLVLYLFMKLIYEIDVYMFLAEKQNRILWMLFRKTLALRFNQNVQSVS